MKTLYAKQKVFKIEDHYPIMDENGEAVYQVDQNFKFFGYEVHVSRADGTPVFVITQELLKFLPTFHVRFENGDTMTIKSRISFLKKKIDVEYSEENLSITGDVWDWDFALREGEREVASVTRKFLTWGDTFTLDIFDDAYSDVVVAAMIAIDRLIDIEESAN